ncbi:DNA-binding transcriptional regulator, AcrR family [Duganella sacchari]|uniref:DNA-binding transcriptional regulator, AcrR family n=1 Tax=Duganella sacchari TaxID=551987 RepID=A0A1M7I655_9BURK|nr:TetR/AcrR family transcriptional regulator [Duganella sacchari]SHM36175.1 DNA-binding transcriptional regulator, AcrR family [Duganella sacchari]
MPKRDPGHMAAVRQQILSAARAVFERKGLYDASMSDVSKEAGLSVGSLYVHFRSKEAILVALIETAELSGAPFAACGSAAALLELVETILHRQEAPDTAGQAARTALEVAAIARRSPEVQAVVIRNYEQLRSAVLDAVARVNADAAGLDAADALAVGESLLSLLIAAQSQMLIGVPTTIDTKIAAARMLISRLHATPVRKKR